MLSFFLFFPPLPPPTHTDHSNKLLYEILFDEEFLGGLALRCSQNRAYRLPPSCLLNISYGLRLENEKAAQKSAGRSPRSDLNYASAAASPHTQQFGDGPTPHNYPYFRSKFRFSATALQGYLNPEQYQPQPKGYDAVDYDNRYGNYGSGSTHPAYGQRSMEFVPESSRPPRFNRGRGRGDYSPNERGRRENGGSRERPPSLADKPTPVLMQRRGGGRGGGGGEVKVAGRQPSKQSRNIEKEYSSTETESQDEFSAALQALPKMKPASAASTPKSTFVSASPQANGGDAERGRGKHEKKEPHIRSSDHNKDREKQPSPKKNKKRELSPSVAAMFEAVSASQQSSSDVFSTSDDMETRDEGPSATLKSMLNIQGQGGALLPIATTTAMAPPPTVQPRIPDALQKLLRAPPPAPHTIPQHPVPVPPVMGFLSPRAPLLPYPGFQQPPPPQIPLGGTVYISKLGNTYKYMY